MLVVIWRAAVLLGAVVLATPFAMMLGAVETLSGAAFALGWLLVLAAGLLHAMGMPRLRPCALVCAVAGLLALGLVVARAPDGRGDPAAGLTSHYLPGRAFAAWSPANLIPELDQLSMEHTTFRPLIQRAFGDSYVGCMTYQLPVQREIAAHPEWVALGSSGMHEGWSEVCTKLANRPSAEPSHWYRYVPPHAPGERLPVIVFFHGFGCNAKSDLWCWRPIADRLHVAVVHPSFGFGLLDLTPPKLDRFLEAWRADADLDWSRAYVGGLSNGSVRAALAAADRPGLFRGVILLSPVKEALHAVGMPIWHNDRPLDPAPYPPVLAIYGGQDGFTYGFNMEKRQADLAKRGIAFTLKRYDDMDHYVNFRARERYEADVASWFAGLR